MADEDLPPSLRGGAAIADLPPSLRSSMPSDDLPPSLRSQATATDLPPSLRSAPSLHEQLDPLEARATNWNTEANPAANLYLTADVAKNAYGILRHPIQTIEAIKSIPSAVKDIKGAISDWFAKGAADIATEAPGGPIGPQLPLALPPG